MERTGQQFLISGRVQGVGYRAYAVSTAQRLGITGWARNLDDGRVEVHAVGSRVQLDELEAELRRGPRMADVTGVEVKAAAASNVRGFSVRS